MGEVPTKEVGDVVVVAPKGPLDEQSTRDLGVKLDELVKKGKLRIVVDLGNVPRISGGAMRLFLSTNRRLSARGGGLVIGRPCREAAGAITVAGLHQLCRVCSSLEEAIDSLRVSERIEKLADLVAKLLAKAEERWRIKRGETAS